MAFQVRVFEGNSAPSEAPKGFKESLETRYEDAGFTEDATRRESVFYFSEGLVVLRERQVEGATVEELIERVAKLEETAEDTLLGPHAAGVTEHRFRFRVILADGGLMDIARDKVKIAKLLFQETGSLGEAELSMLEKVVIDSGENVWVVSPVGVLLIGEFEDVRRCTYLIA